MFGKTLFTSAILALPALTSAQGAGGLAGVLGGGVPGLASITGNLSPQQTSDLVNGLSSYFASIVQDPTVTSELAGLATDTSALAQLQGLQTASSLNLAQVNSILDSLPTTQAQLLHSIIAAEINLVQSVVSTTVIVADASTTYLATGGASATGSGTSSTAAAGNISGMTTSISGTSTGAGASTASTRSSSSSTSAAAATANLAPAATGSVVKVAGAVIGVLGAAVAML